MKVFQPPIIGFDTPLAFLFRIWKEPCLGIFDKNHPGYHPVGTTTMSPGLPLASATAKAVPAAVPVGLVKVRRMVGGYPARGVSLYSTRSPTDGSESSTNFLIDIDWVWKAFFWFFFCHPIEFVIPQEELKHPTRVVHESSFWLRSCLKRKISWDMSHRIVSNKEGHWKIHQR